MHVTPVNSTLLCRVVVPVTTKHDKACSLQAYMRFPVSQYVMIDVGSLPYAQQFSQLSLLLVLCLPKHHLLFTPQSLLVQVPMGGLLRRVGEDMFDVTVPHVRFFDLWVQPRVRCQVRSVSQPALARLYLDETCMASCWSPAELCNLSLLAHVGAKYPVLAAPQGQASRMQMAALPAGC